MTKTSVAAALAAVALTAAPVAHADYEQDDKFIAELKAHGLIEGEDYANDNAEIVNAHNDCDELAKGTSRDTLVNEMPTGIIPRSTWAITTDAAIDVYCPQFKGH
jgi:Protein of unknown function (DUF732)